MLVRALRMLKQFWTLLMEVEVRYTSVPLWSPWRDFTFHNEEDFRSSR
jgi:hypothetical protein